MMPAVPASGTFTNAVRPAFVVEIEELPLDGERVRTFVPAMMKLLLTVVRSVKTRLPMVRTVSSVTVRSAVMLKVKFAVDPAPSATVPLAQGPAVQVALPSTAQVPLAALISGGAASVAMAAAMLVVRILRRWRVFFIDGACWMWWAWKNPKAGRGPRRGWLRRCAASETRVENMKEGSCGGVGWCGD